MDIGLKQPFKYLVPLGSWARNGIKEGRNENILIAPYSVHTICTAQAFKVQKYSGTVLPTDGHHETRMRNLSEKISRGINISESVV
jgi:hypothetical protein